LFAEANWLAVMIGQNLVPESYDPLVDAIDVEVVKRNLQRMRALIRQAVEAAPAHRTYIQNHCAAMPPSSAAISAIGVRS